MKKINVFLATALLSGSVISSAVYAANYGSMLATPSFAERWKGKHIKVKPESGAAPLRVSFEPFFPEDRVRQELKYEWDFGDGQSSIERTPTHVYGSPGVYTVKFKRHQLGAEGLVSEGQKRIVVSNGVNIEPRIEFEKLSASYAPGDEVILDASLAIDEDGVIRSYQWTQYLEEKDKHVHLSGAQSARSSFLMPESAPDGKLHFELKVEDDQGAVAYRTIIVLLSDVVKIAVNNPIDFAPLEAHFRLDISPRKKIENYTMDYEGDGINDIISDDSDGFSYLYTKPGVYHPVATLVDDSGAGFTGTTTINVLSRANEEESIRKRYQLMAKALLNNEIDLATQYFTEAARPGIAGVFTAMGPERVSAIFGREIKKVKIHEWYGGMARVLIFLRNPGAQAQLPVFEMIRDTKGVWYFSNL